MSDRKDNSGNGSIADRFLAREFPQQSPLISRLQQFIPQISADNERLKKEGTVVQDDGISIEQVPMKANGEEEESASSDDSSSDEESESSSFPRQANNKGPHVEFDLHVIGSGDEAEHDEDTDGKQRNNQPKLDDSSPTSKSTPAKRKLIEEIE